LIAKLGMPLDEAKQTYQHMNSKFRESLKDSMIQICSEEDINILVQSFVRQVDNNNQFSALDSIHCINAVLECPTAMNDIILKTNKLVNPNEKDVVEDKDEKN
jgi:hypothetical protein